MVEPTSPQPSPLPRRGMPLPVQRFLFLFCGLALGAAIVLATLRLIPRQERVVYRDVPASKSVESKAPVPGSSEPTGSAATQPGSAKPTDPASKAPVKTTKPSADPSNPSMQPYNPFDGSVMPPKEISGHITPGSAVRLPIVAADNEPTVTPAHDDPAPRGLLVMIRLSVSDPDGALKSLQSMAASAGGSAIQYDESAERSDPEGAVLVVPSTKAAEIQKRLGSVGSVVVSDSWNGSTTDRLERIEGPAENRLRELRIRRQELLVRYLEDAPEIRHIDEDSARIQGCVAALRARKPGSATAVIKVRFLG